MSSILTRALKIKQNSTTSLFSFFLQGKDIDRVADISRIKKDNVDELFGYQRNAVRNHINEISAYLNSEDVLFPNAIILAMSSEVTFKQSRGPQIGDGLTQAGVLEIPTKEVGKKVAWIVDGQQRTLALTKCKKKELLVPVTAFISDDFDVHREQFLLVNKVKPLPKGLIDELLPTVNTTLPPSLSVRKIPSELCNILNKDTESPFRGLIHRQTTNKKDLKAVIRDNSLMQVIKDSLNNIHGCLYQYKNVATGEIDVENIRMVLNLYWSVVKDTFPEAWGKDPKYSRLMGGVGIKSMGNLMDRIMCTIHPSDPGAQEKVKNSLLPLKGNCAWTEGNWKHLNGVPWDFLQNTSRDVKLLSNTLIRLHTGVAT